MLNFCAPNFEFIYQTVLLGFGICMHKKQTDKQSGLFNSLRILTMSSISSRK
ncbi:hypothetical protein MtrunA17_Chr1g0151161 [Medicago truncatula]|uniref:Uncharacterized protein n=1 Tax=Medicago truncatula TaxID=3880 RepID=A0A396JLH1_MEDTR|nr:hypothetical protein MtrunA17_Chr1g0151161 [Medicago truncatula]